ncbi:MAG: hypothetical protein R3E87_14360 [Burkholderiaceae bacterium]
MAVTLGGCGDWSTVDPTSAQAAVANAGVSKDLIVAAPPMISKENGGDVPITTASAKTSTVVSKGIAGADGTPSPAAPINDADTILSDMRRMNDLPLRNVDSTHGWATGPGQVEMGNGPRTVNTPGWWQALNPQWMNDVPMTRLQPWATQFEGVGNTASNARIQVRGLQAYVLSRATGDWQLTHEAQRFDGSFCPQGGDAAGCVSGTMARPEPTGGYSFKPMPGMSFHGQFGGRQSIDAADVQAVFVTFEARLVVDDANAIDDTATARYLMHVGADYYAGETSTETMPAVAISRAKLLTTQWQAFNMVTVDGVGVHNPGGGMSLAQFLANPPPLD